MALIMIADDDSAVLSVLKDFLESRGHQVVTVADGVAASLKAQDWKPALIISDIMMPGAYGTTAYKSLENAGVVPKTPVIFITSVEMDKARKVVPDNPKTRLLSKPVDLAKLDAAVADLLD
jgi:CheY-like chemotaxis protein